MNEKIKNELDNIVKTLAGTGMVSRIILFGSCARGEETLDSDIDLCVLTPLKNKRPIELIVDFRLKLMDVKSMPVDIFAYNQDAFYDKATHRLASFHHEISETGVLLYDRV
jgi:uncharacterized protein